MVSCVSRFHMVRGVNGFMVSQVSCFHGFIDHVFRGFLGFAVSMVSWFHRFHGVNGFMVSWFHSFMCLVVS